MVKTKILIIGAGFAGLSTAYHLAKKGSKNIVVIEGEKKLGGHASGRNAGMIRQAVSDPILARLAREGRNALSRLKPTAWKGIDFTSSGSLLLGKKEAKQELNKIKSAIENEKIISRWVSEKEAARHVSVLKNADFEKALFCPSDATLKIEALLKGFLGELRRLGVPVLRGYKVHAIERKGAGFLVRAGAKTFFTEKIVNAAGGCVGLIAEKAGATAIPFRAYRRHLFQSRVFPAAKKKWPFVWDISHNVYFRPVGKGLLLSPCDKTAVDSGYLKAGKEKNDPTMRKTLFKKLAALSQNFRNLKIKKVKSGLRTMAPDGRFVIGEDPKLKGFFWVAGLGGHGVTTCFSVGNLASDLILRRRVERSLVNALTPKRFVTSRG